MKKVFAMGLVVSMLLAGVILAGVNGTNVGCDLDFEGNEAICYAAARGFSDSDSISLSMTLYQGGSVIDSWSDSGTGYVELDGYATVDMGDYYTLDVEATINGRTYTDSDSGMCE